MKSFWFLLILFLPLILFLSYIFIFQTQKTEVSKNETVKQTTTTTTEIKPYQPIPIIETPGKNEIFLYENETNPSSLQIKLGEVIKFINKDTKTHSLTFSDPPLTKNIPGGTDWSFQFTKVGSFTVNDETNGKVITITVS
jgi:plastocyanin